MSPAQSQCPAKPLDKSLPLPPHRWHIEDARTPGLPLQELARQRFLRNWQRLVPHHQASLLSTSFRIARRDRLPPPAPHTPLSGVSSPTHPRVRQIEYFSPCLL